MTTQSTTGRQAMQAQIDAWMDRHDVHAFKTVPMPEQTAQALYRDHAEALEMNANGDAGRAAFLGISDCLGMPPGFESPCGVILEPHGPHSITPEQAVEPTSQDVARRVDRMKLTASEHNFLVGWLTSGAPAAMDDALDAVEAYRERIVGYRRDREAVAAALPRPIDTCDGLQHDEGCAYVAWARNHHGAR